MSVPSPAVELWQSLIAAVQSGDLDRARSLIQPTFEWQAMGRGPFAGRYVGAEGLAELLGKVHEASGGTFHLDTETTVGDDDTAAIVGRVTATRDGRALDARNVFLLQCEGGKIARGWTVPMDQYAFDEFWR